MLSDEALSKRKTGFIADSLSQLDDSSFDKKMVKIYKALRMMEQAKAAEPKFSEAMKDLGKFLSDLRKSVAGDTMSRLSSVGGLGDFWKKGDDTSSIGFGMSVFDQNNNLPRG